MASRGAFAAGIAAAYADAVGAGFEVGRRLIAAKEGLDHGDFQAMIAADLPFGPRLAQMFMAVARDARLANTQRVSLLPDGIAARYALTRLDDAALEDAFDRGAIGPATTRADAVRIKMEAAAGNARAETEARIAAAPAGEAFAGDIRDGLARLIADGRRFGALLADPPWKFRTWSAKGDGRKPPYPTLTLAELAALPVAQVAADDAVLFLWGVRWAVARAEVAQPDAFGDGAARAMNVPMAALLMKAWGFELVTTAFTWVKRDPDSDDGEGAHRGAGHWTRANPEPCFLGTRGSPARLSAAVDELVVAPVGAHSEKPGEVHDRIAALVAGPYLELFARLARPGWTAIGNQLGFPGPGGPVPAPVQPTRERRSRRAETGAAK